MFNFVINKMTLFGKFDILRKLTIEMHQLTYKFTYF